MARVAILLKEDAKIEDEEEARKYAIKTGRWDLFYKLRPNDKAIRDMWEEGEEVPGVAHNQYAFVSVTKL